MGGGGASPCRQIDGKREEGQMEEEEGETTREGRWRAEVGEEGKAMSNFKGLGRP